MKKVLKAFVHWMMKKLFGSWKTMMLLFLEDFNVGLLSLARGEKERKARASAEEAAFNPSENHTQAARPYQKGKGKPFNKSKDKSKDPGKETTTFAVDHNAEAQEATQLLLTYRQTRIRMIGAKVPGGPQSGTVVLTIQTRTMVIWHI